MIESDNDLRKALREWKAPVPSTGLDERVWNSYAGTRHSSWGPRRWLPIAAGIVLVAGLSMHLFSGPKGPQGPSVTKVKTTTNAVGFEPLPDGAITITKKGEK